MLNGYPRTIYRGIQATLIARCAWTSDPMTRRPKSNGSFRPARHVDEHLGGASEVVG
jgi:hypothetical protein